MVAEDLRLEQSWELECAAAPTKVLFIFGPGFLWLQADYALIKGQPGVVSRDLPGFVVTRKVVTKLLISKQNIRSVSLSIFGIWVHKSAELPGER